jgi:hypothetical protein
MRLIISAPLFHSVAHHPFCYSVIKRAMSFNIPEESDPCSVCVSYVSFATYVLLRLLLFRGTHK